MAVDVSCFFELQPGKLLMRPRLLAHCPRGHRPRLNIHLTECFALLTLRKLGQATWTYSGSVEAGSHGTAGQNVYGVVIACGAGPVAWSLRFVCVIIRRRIRTNGCLGRVQ